MPRNACAECRSRKIRCFPGETGQRCQPCAARKLVCSHRPPSRGLPLHPSDGRRSPHLSMSQVASLSPSAFEDSPPLFRTDQTQRFVLLDSNAGLDLGAGTPSELLREAEFTQTLLLLYFSNFDDIHVMFDQTSFMRQFVLGNASKPQLFAIMALGIRYSHANFSQPTLRPHWGEPLFHESRRLLKEEFDLPSVATAQTYVLLATYQLTFGGARKAWMYLGFARNIVSLFKLGVRHDGASVFEDEMTRRLVATIAIMENLFTPSVNIERGLSPMQLSTKLNGELNATIGRTRICGPAELGPSLAIMNEILHLSEVHYRIRRAWHTQTASSLQQDFAATLQQWQEALPSYLRLAPENFEYHQERLSLRRYAFMHLLQLHLRHLLLFKQLEWPPTIHSTATRDPSAVEAYEHASRITSIVNWLWHTSQLEMHNASFGQIVTIAQVIHIHRLLSSTDADTISSTQSEITALQEYLLRVKRHCRLFNWVVAQLEWFMHICTQRDFWLDERSWRSVIYDQLMTLGTSFERLDYDTGGHMGTMESLADFQTYSQQRAHQTPQILLRGFIPGPLGSLSDTNGYT